jgi:hypothetical protein
MNSFWDSLPPSTFVNEADVEHQLVLPLLYALGYETKEIVPKYPVEFREGRRGRKPEADFVCFNGTVQDRDSSLLVVETKAPNESLTGGKEQGESYAANLRAPVLVMTNGGRFEAWQLQSTRESEKVIDVAVADLIATRGKLESLLSKKALVKLCERLNVKSFAKSAAQHKEYVAAEYARISKAKESINRTLRHSGMEKDQATLPSDRLIQVVLRLLGCVRHLFAKNYKSPKQANRSVGRIARFHSELYAFPVGGEFPVVAVALKKRVHFQLIEVFGREMLLRHHLD